MGNILKIILWLAIIALVAYLIFGKSGNKAEAPLGDDYMITEDMGGPAGDRAELDNNDQTRDSIVEVEIGAEVQSTISEESETESTQ